MPIRKQPVYPGQEVAVKIDTLNFTKYGLLSGNVDSVSQDAVLQNKPVDENGVESAKSTPYALVVSFLLFGGQTFIRADKVIFPQGVAPFRF
jgi:hypothetical protein